MNGKWVISAWLLLALSSGGCSTWEKLNDTERGAVIGGGAGAVIGNAVSDNAGGTLLGGAAGALGGGIIGNQMEQRSGEERRYRYGDGDYRRRY